MTREERDRLRALRFWSKVDKRGPQECWLWTAAKDRGDYGSFALAHRGQRRQRRAHRVAYELTHGAIPDGLCVLHRCDVRACCNPAHMWLGTQADNMADKMRKGRHRSPTGERHGSHTRPERLARGERNGSRTHPERVPRGERAGGARLTDVAVREIRALAGSVSQREIAARFGVGQQTISRAVLRQTWGHVT